MGSILDIFGGIGVVGRYLPIFVPSVPCLHPFHVEYMPLYAYVTSNSCELISPYVDVAPSVCPSMCMSALCARAYLLHIFCPPCVRPLRAYVSFVSMSPHMLVASCVCPLRVYACSSAITSPPCVCLLRVHVASCMSPSCV